MPSEYDISKAFKRIEDDLLDSMMRNLKRHQVEENELGITWEQWQVLQLQELEQYRQNNLKKFSKDFKDIDKKVDQLFRDTANNAQSAEENALLGKIKSKQFTPDVDKGGFFRLNEPKLEALIMATQSDFKRAEYAMLRQANDQYRKIIFDAMTYANVTNDYKKATDIAVKDFIKGGVADEELKRVGLTYEQAIDMSTKELLKAGIRPVVYSNGARHSLSDYASMALRTGNKRAYLMGEGNAHDKYGLHYVRVNKRQDACPKCVGFLGKVLCDDVYGGGTRAEANKLGVPTLSDAIQAGFLHPNCKDMYSVYIPGVSKEAKPWTEQEIGDIVGEYNQEQEIKHAQDMQETYQRMAKYSLDPSNQAMYQKRADDWGTRVTEIQGTPPTPVVPTLPPIVETPTNVASQATSPTVVEPKITEEAQIRQRIADIKSRGVAEKLAEAEREHEVLKDYYNTYENVKVGAVAHNQDLSERLLAQAEKYRLKQVDQSSKMFADFEKKYRYINDHLQEFENGTYADDVKARIKDLKKQAKAVQKELDIEYNALEAIIGEPNVTRLAVYGDKNTDAIKRFLDDAPASLKNLWDKCADNFNTLAGTDRWGRRRKGAYYSSTEDGVWLSIKSVAKGDDLHPAYETVFHEFGHNIDYVLNRKIGNGNTQQAFTEVYKNGIFGKTVREETEKAIEKYGRDHGFFRMVSEQEITDDADRMVMRRLMREDEKAEYIARRMANRTEIFERVEAEKAFAKEIKANYTLAERGDISDMMESCFSFDYPFSAGHGKKRDGTRYWDDYGVGKQYIRVGREAFAEMYASSIANNGSWKLIQEFFPESVKIFEEIVEMENTL